MWISTLLALFVKTAVIFFLQCMFLTPVLKSDGCGSLGLFMGLLDYSIGFQGYFALVCMCVHACMRVCVCEHMCVCVCVPIVC